MSRQRVMLLFEMFLFPFYAFAHGEEVLLPLFVQLALIFIFLAWLTFVKFRIINKLILAASYFLTLGLILVLTWNVSYRQHRTSLDIAWTIAPAAISWVTFIILRNKKKREINQQTN